MEGVKGVKGGLARPLPGGPSGLALLKGVDRWENHSYSLRKVRSRPGGKGRGGFPGRDNHIYVFERYVNTVEVLGRLGIVFGASWVVLGASWASLEASWTILG